MSIAPRVNAELRPDGTEDREMAAYVDGVREAITAIEIIAALDALAAQDEGDKTDADA